MPDHLPSETDLRRRTSYKWRLHPDEVLPMFVAEMDLPLAEPVAAAITEAVAAGDTGYPWGDDYRDAWDGFARQRWGWEGIAADRVAMMPDVMGGVLNLLNLVDAGAVVVNNPVYPMFYRYVQSSGRPIVEAPLGSDERLDLDALDAGFRQAAATGPNPVFLLCSPHNPTGTLHTRDELVAVAALARDHGVRVISDEIHAPLVAPGEQFTPYLSVSGTEADFALLSASKAWNLAALKAAIAVTGAEGGLAGLPLPATHGHSHLGVIAQCAALRAGGQWLDTANALIESNRALLVDLLAEHLPQVRYRPGRATYLAWLDCRDLGLGEDPAQVFLDRGHVAFGPGAAFGSASAGWVRSNLAGPPQFQAESVRRMVSAVRNSPLP